MRERLIRDETGGINVEDFETNQLLFADGAALMAHSEKV